ncbi:hypothetical protein BVY03_00490 [bacterium K02(2017)]|nr:hypothetical protein BVY03_00490 [bacterium K02(2017)]
MNLTNEQQQAVTSPSSVAVIASAGTGKTTVLTQRYLNCYLNNNVSLYNILAFTFTEKATREMKARIIQSDHLNLEQVPLLNISTIHSFCLRLLRRHGYLVGLKSDFQIIDDTGFKLYQQRILNDFIAQEIIEKNTGFIKFIKFYGVSNLTKTITDLFKEDLINLKPQDIKILNLESDLDHQTLESLIKSTKDFCIQLQNNRISKQQITYDDLEYLCLKILKQSPTIIQELQQRYKHILVDEFQDVSPRQYKLIKTLYNPEHNKLFIVGDPKQSIYRFRQANHTLFYKMSDLIKNHQGECIYLTQTFRTPQKLLKFFNHVFPKLITHQTYQNGSSPKVDANSYIYAQPIPLELNKETNKHIYHAQKTANLTNSLIQNNCDPKEIAVLFFSRTQMAHYEQAFTELNIPYCSDNKTTFMDDPLILTVWHILKYLSGIKDKISQVGIIRNNIFNLSEGFIDHLNKSKGENIFSEQTLDLFAPHEDKEIWIHLCNKLNKWGQNADCLSAAELFETICLEIVNNPPTKQKVLINHVSNIIQSWQQQGVFYLFQAKVLIQKLGDLNPSQNNLIKDEQKGVQFLTIHGSKGLEFNHVFLAPGSRSANDSSLFYFEPNKGFVFKTHDCDQEKTLKYQLEEPESFLGIKAKEKEMDLEELTRLIYVALTRAKQCLYFIVDKPSQVFIKSTKKNPAETKIIKNYNEWMYWLTQIDGKEFITEQMPELSKSNNKAILDSCPPKTTIQQSTSKPPSKTLTSILTVTEIENFYHCHQRYNLRYLKRIAPIKQHNQTSDNDINIQKNLSAIDRGNFYHEILQYYDYNRNNQLDVVIDQALFNQHIIDDKNLIRPEAHELIDKIKHDSFCEKLLFDNLESFEEIEFSLKLNDFILTGQIDKLVKTKDDQGIPKWVIIDFKTHYIKDQSQREQLIKKFSFQMSCYALAISKKYNLHEIETVILFTSGPSYHIIEHTHKQLNDFEELLNKNYQQYKTSLAANIFNLTNDEENCKTCGYFKENYCGINN